MKVKLIHISTDYVFDGQQKIPYCEDDKPRPLNQYGISKLKGENKIIKENLKNSIILRTSWLYSYFGNNFFNKILSKIKEGSEINVIGNEYGSPTNSLDLAKIIIKIINKINFRQTRIYNFSNSGICSRYDFAFEINRILGSPSKINKIDNSINIAKRPKFSALNSQKIKKDFNIQLTDWKISLENYINKLN